MTIIFKVLTPPEWEKVSSEAAFVGSAADVRDGFIHLSTAEQAEETVLRHFPNAAELFLLAVDAKALGAALRWETSRGGALFPHLYRPLSSEDILWARSFDAGRPAGLRKLLAE